MSLASAADAPPGARFLGTQACASSGCHGGAGAHQNQSLIWSTRDFHSQRPFATLTTARSKQIAGELQITDPTRDTRCTSCHAPLANVPALLQAAPLKASEGVSCESCHGPAERWLRPHTRPDYTRADRAALGLRDLQNLYVRANTCVACHQTVELPLLQAGHPELIFELDGQCVTEPKHWRAQRDAPGPQAWLVGQAVALREMSWQQARERGTDAKLAARGEALRWLVGKLEKLDASSTAPEALQQAADGVARRVADQKWSEQLTRQHLAKLAGCAADFRDTGTPQSVQARRAERLVLALNRLTTALNLDQGDGKTALENLFHMAQSLSDFAPEKFAAQLDDFSGKVHRTASR